MSVRILYDADRDYAVMYCSTSMWAFGPIFSSEDEGDAQQRAEAFLEWLERLSNFGQYEQSLIGAPRRDARLLTEAGLSAAYADWLVYTHQPEVQS